MTGTDGADMTKRPVAICGELGDDEQRVLLLVAERLHMGQRRYGLLNIAADPRDFGREALAEIADAAVYVACALMRGRA